MSQLENAKVLRSPGANESFPIQGMRKKLHTIGWENVCLFVVFFFLNSCGLFQKKEEEQKLHGMLCHVDALAFLGILIEIIGRDHVVA